MRKVCQKLICLLGALVVLALPAVAAKPAAAGQKAPVSSKEKPADKIKLAKPILLQDDPLDTELMARQRVLDQTVADGLFTTVHLGLMPQLGTLSEALGLGFYAKAQAVHRIYTYRGVYFSGLLASNFVRQSQRANFPTETALSIWGIFAGGSVGYDLPFAKRLSVHLNTAFGYSVSFLRNALNEQLITSGDPALLTGLEVQWTSPWRKIFFAAEVSYMTVLYKGDFDSSTLGFTLGVGYSFTGTRFLNKYR